VLCVLCDNACNTLITVISEGFFSKYWYILVNTLKLHYNPKVLKVQAELKCAKAKENQTKYEQKYHITMGIFTRN